MIIQQVHNSHIYYDETPIYYIKDYYNYIVTTLKHVLKDKNVNIIIGEYSYNFNNSNKTIRVHINYEHTLLNPLINTIGTIPIGHIPVLDSSETYLVQVYQLEMATNSDIVFEYSIPNIINIITSNIYNSLIDKLIYIPPIVYPLYYEISTRKINVLTTFIDNNIPRRIQLLDSIKNNSISHININNCFDINDLQRLYLNTKILINIHQNENYHTFEELRVLPALLCGVIVICEDSPLKETIPYTDHVIWAKYDTIVTKVNEVLLNYDTYHKTIFSNTSLNTIIETMKVNTLDAINKRISDIIRPIGISNT